MTNLDHPEDRRPDQKPPEDRQRMVEHVRRDLEQIPDAYALAGLFLVRGTTGEITRASSGSRPPLDLGVIDLLDEREKRDSDPSRTDAELDRMAGARRQGVLPTLSSWVRLVDGERWDEGDEHQGPPTQRTVLGECGWLIESLDWIVEQKWLGELADDLRGIRRDLRAAIRDRDVTEHLVCIQPGCGWDVQPQAGGSWFRCSGCGESWGRIELHKMAERKRARPLKACAAILDAPHRTLRYLVAEGRLRHVARDGNAYLYDVQDAAAALAWVRIRDAQSRQTTSV